MSSKELAHRMGLSKARIGQIERGERERTITLDTLERAAEALGCRVEYVLVPHEPLEDLVWARAIAKATEEFAQVDHTMELEDQRPHSNVRAALIEETARHHIDKRGLWS